MTEPSWDTPESLFTDDPARATFLATFADVMRGAGGRPKRKPREFRGAGGNRTRE